MHGKDGSVACGGLAKSCEQGMDGNVACGIADYWHRHVNTVLKAKKKSGGGFGPRRPF